MNTLSEFECNLSELDAFAKELSLNVKVSDFYLLDGELGTGKTTFARSFINSIFDNNKIERPDNIKSPSFPIMINYPINNFEICHYDFYRIKNKTDLMEINFFENSKNNISIIEWPNIFINNFNIIKYYLIQFKFIDLKKRLIKIKYIENTKIVL